MKTKITASALAAMMLLLCAGCGGAEPAAPSTDDPTNEPPEGPTVVTQPIEVTNETYGSFWLRCHDYKTMPVGVYNAVTAGLADNAELYSSYKEAGVNMLIGCWEGVSIEAFNLCADNGIGYFASTGNPDGNFDQSLLSAGLAQVKYHEAFCGVTVADEPGRVHFEQIVQTQDFLDGIMPEMTAGTLWWSNLFPNYAKYRQLYYRTYEKGQSLPPEMHAEYKYDRYLSEYMEICKPKVLSFDNYGCHVGKANRGKVRKDYFENISVCRAAAMEANIPFWHFVQDCQFNDDSFALDQGELLWSVNTGLSFGAKGIEYFTGVAVADFESKGYEGAMFTGTGERTEVYNRVKTANAQIAAVDEVLMCSKSKGLIVIGEMPTGQDGNATKIPESDLIETYGEYASATAKHALIGCFDYNGKTAFYVTNNSVSEEDTLNISFHSSTGGYIVQKAVKTPFTGSSLEISFGAGEGVLIVLG